MTTVSASPSPPAPNPVPPPTFAVGTWLFLRLLALVHLIAFTSAWRQLGGLVGPHGILPAGTLFAAYHRQLGATVYRELPSLCWWLGTGPALTGLCLAGMAAAVLLFAGIAPVLCLVFLWIDYLSIACAGQIFFDFQWDALLLETTLLAILLAPWSLRAGWKRWNPPTLARGLLCWLLFRLMFLSGLVKLGSGDPTWRHLTALTFHYQTQPLPTPLAWYAHQWPPGFHHFCAALMFAIELLAPFALFAPRWLRHPAALAMIALQLAIAATGNYTFFNLITIALCLLCLDDTWWGRIANSRTLSDPAPGSPALKPVNGHLLRLAAVVVIVFTVTEALADFFSPVADEVIIQKVVGLIAPFRSLNNYGLFARMTTKRPELVFQGSEDGFLWKSYEFPHKPGNLARRPDFVAPGQPRLDWQLWFAALGYPENNRWVVALCERLLRGTPEVLALFSVNPFPQQPPHYLRVVRYDYQFTTAAERAQTGNWWKRDVMDFYVPSMSLP